MLDTIIINPGGRQQTYQDLNKKFTGIEPPIWAGLIANFLKQKLIKLKLVDTNALMIDPREMAQIVQEEKPILVTIVIYGHNPSASTQTMPSAGALAREIKKLNPNQKIIFVGGHVTALPHQTLIEESCDYVCTGEGPITVYELIKQLKNDPSQLKHIPSLAYLGTHNQLNKTKAAPLLSDLDKELPGVAWELLPMEKYRAHNWHGFTASTRYNYASIYTTLGCPFNCSFCCIQAPFKESELVSNLKRNSYRSWSPKFILAQIDSLVKNYNIKNLKIADELFIMKVF